jgi:Ca2+-binding RTX toxin-like protein
MPIGRIGTDFIVNTTTTGDQSDITVTALPDGRFVMMWTSADAGDGSSLCVRGRVFFPDGSPAGDDFILNTTTNNAQLRPSAVALEDGRFLIVFESNAGTGDESILGRVFEPDGSSSDDDFAINTTVGGAQFFSSVTALSDGRFMVVWQSTDTGDGAGSCVRGRLLDADGAPIGDDFIVNSTTQGDQKDPFVAGLSDGRFVTVWESSDNGDNSGDCIRGRVFNADGSPAAADFIVNQTITGDQADPAVTALANGRFVVTWSSADGGDGTGDCIRGRTFSADGLAEGNDFLLNLTGPGNQLRPAIAALADGRLVAVWDSGDGGDGSGFGIRARLFSDNGNPIGDDFIVNTVGQNNQIAPTVAALADGRFVVTWQSADTGDGSGLTVRSQIFDPTVLIGTDGISEALLGGTLDDRIYGGGGVDTIVGNDGNDILSGDSGNDFLQGTGGDDILRGGTGADNMSGGGDSDTYFVDDAGDVVVEENVAGIDTVNSSVSFNLTGQFIERLFLTGTGNIDGTGNGLANTIRGTSGNNRLDGAVGADSMEGKGGNDTYIVNNAGDVVIEAANGGTDTVESSVSHTLSVFVENLKLTGAANVNGTGNDGANQLTGNSGANSLDGQGGGDKMTGLGGNDTYHLDNAGDEAIEAANAGIDTVQTSISKILGANLEKLVLKGSANINGFGNTLANEITGNAGANIINGAAGSDTLTGGGGIDFFRFNTAIGPGNVDTVTDFEIDVDKLQLENTIFTAIGASLTADEFVANASGTATNGLQHILYNTTNGRLFYDADGTGGQARVHFATLTAGPPLDHLDFVII